MLNLGVVTRRSSPELNSKGCSHRCNLIQETLAAVKRTSSHFIRLFIPQSDTISPWESYSQATRNRSCSSKRTKEQHRFHKFCTLVSAVDINQVATIISDCHHEGSLKEQVLYMAEMTYRLKRLPLHGSAAEEMNPAVCFIKRPLSACSCFKYFACGTSAKFLLLRSYPSYTTNGVFVRQPFMCRNAQKTFRLTRACPQVRYDKRPG